MHKHLTSATVIAMFAFAGQTIKAPLVKMNGDNNFAPVKDFNSQLETAIQTTGLFFGRDILFEKRDDQLAVVLTNEGAFSMASVYIEHSGISAIVSPTFERRAADGMYEALVTKTIFMNALRTGTAKAKQTELKNVVFAEMQRGAWIAKLLSLHDHSIRARESYLEADSGGKTLKTA